MQKSVYKLSYSRPFVGSNISDIVSILKVFLNHLINKRQKLEFSIVLGVAQRASTDYCNANGTSYCWFYFIIIIFTVEYRYNAVNYVKILHQT